MERPEALERLAMVSARIGRNLHLVQGAGGNSSVKVEDVLWVKASGLWLLDALDQEIFLPVDLAGARAALAAGNATMPVLARFGATSLRPSIETSLHALMHHRAVLHVHAVNSLAWAIRSDGAAEMDARLSGLSWATLPYCKPGLPLARAIAALTANAQPDVLLLGNHGLLVGAETAEAAEDLIQEVETRLALSPHPMMARDAKRLDALCAGTDYRPAKSDDSHVLTTSPRNLALASAGSLYPDHVVFLGPALPCLPADATELGAFLAGFGDHPPVVVLVPGAGALVRKDIMPAAEALLDCLGLVINRLPLEAQIRYLPPAEEQALLDWDAERYRKQLTTKRGG